MYSPVFTNRPWPRAPWCSGIPYFTDYKTNVFLRKIASQSQERLIPEINIKCPVYDLKFPPVLKMAIYPMPRQSYLYLATLDSSGSSSAPMRRTWVWGFTSLLTLSPSHPIITNPEHCLTYDESLQATVPVNLNWKWFVLSVTVQYFC